MRRFHDGLQPSHTSKENALKGILSHDVGAAKEILEEATKEGFLVHKRTGYWYHVSLNIRRRDEIVYIAELLED